MTNRFTSLIKSVAAAAMAVALIFCCAGCSQAPAPAVTEALPTIHNEPAKPISSSTSPVSPHKLGLKSMVGGPEYPEMPQYPNYDDSMDYHVYDEAMSLWYDDYFQRYNQPEGYADSLEPFFRRSMEQFLSGEDNQVCSPVNIYLALAMLAETCGSNTRQQILELLGHTSIDSLRVQAKQVWNAHYCNDGLTTSVLGNSVWLDSEYTFNEEVVSALVDHYYASVFNGDLGTGEMDEQLIAWLDSQTGGLLTEHTQSIQLDPLTAFVLASTAYFSADWSDSFSESQNTREVFHCKDADLTTDFMNQSMMNQSYYWAEDFSAMQLGLSGNHSMWLILPDEGTDPQDLLVQGDYFTLVNDPANWENRKTMTVNLSLPKFDVDSEQDLIPGLKAMGITDVFDSQAADFSPMTGDAVALSGVSHAARVVIDEDGIIAAAYTMMAACGSAMPVEDEIDFRLDRPFLFVVTGKDHLPLFAGVVEHP